MVATLLMLMASYSLDTYNTICIYVVILVIVVVCILEEVENNNSGGEFQVGVENGLKVGCGKERCDFCLSLILTLTNLFD